MDTNRDELNILAPREMKPKFDYLHREVQRAAGQRINRREALGLGGMAILAAAAAAAKSAIPPRPSACRRLMGRPAARCTSRCR